MEKTSTQLREKVKHDHLLHSRAVAEILGKSVRIVHWLAKINRLPGFNIGKRIWYFWEADVLEYLIKTQPNEVYQRAERLAAESNRKVEDLLAQARELSLSPVYPSYEDHYLISKSTDKEVIELSELQVGPRLGRRFSRLLKKKQAGSLDENEQAELLALMLDYQELLLLKAQAQHEAVRRGLREPDSLNA